MFCRHCGSEVKDNAKFCSKCGANVERKNTDANQINRQGETSNNISPQQPSQAPPQQPPRQYISAQQPPKMPSEGGGSKRAGGRSALIIILIIALVAGLCLNIFQFINGTHILSGSLSIPSLQHTGGLSTYKDPDPASIIET